MSGLSHRVNSFNIKNPKALGWSALGLLYACLQGDLSQAVLSCLDKRQRFSKLQVQCYPPSQHEPRYLQQCGRFAVSAAGAAPTHPGLEPSPRRCGRSSGHRPGSRVHLSTAGPCLRTQPPAAPRPGRVGGHQPHSSPRAEARLARRTASPR